jgi:DNA polymerase III epsilon subunit-like protein
VKHPIARLKEVSPELYEVSDLLLDGLSQQRLWLFDLEATGLDTRRERVTQIAGVPLEAGRLLEEAAFVTFVDPGPGVEISREVQELTGITPEKLRGAPSFREAWSAHLRAAEGAFLWIGQSVFEFDVPLLQAELARHALPPRLPAILDSVVLATFLLGPPQGRWSTSALLQRYAVDTGELRRHDALDDVKILARILLPMLGQLRDDHGGRIVIDATKPLQIKRHPPIDSTPKPGS